MPRLPGVVGRVTGENDPMYEIVTSYGILAVKYRAGDLEYYHGELNIDVSSITNTICVRKASQYAANRSQDLADIVVTCKCAGKCADKRCKCLAKRQKCGSHCHQEGSSCCTNKDQYFFLLI